MKYQPFAYLTFSLVIGILVGEYYSINTFTIIGLLSMLFVTAICIYRFQKFKVVFGIVICLMFMLMGTLSINYKLYQSRLVPDLHVDKEQIWKIKVISQERSSEKFNKYLVNVYTDSLKSKIQSKNLLYVRRGKKILHTDDEAYVYAKWQKPYNNKNPESFDYTRFLQRKNIHFQTFVDTLYHVSHNQTLSHKASAFKVKIKQSLKDLGFSPSSRFFIQALALGDRLELDKKHQTTLANAGVIHLFAISGLHIGIVLGIFYYLTNGLLYLRYGRIVQRITSIIFIWTFAWFVDFSPSVLRASIMITIVIGLALMKKPINLLHSLFVTAFFILIISPYQLFNVGFLLSFNAVFFIVWLGIPLIENLPFRNRKIRYVESIVIIMLSAQIGVLPVLLFYFNQFSGAFFVPNLVLLPIAGLLVILSFFTVIFLPLFQNFPLLIHINNLIYSKLYSFIEWFAELDNLIFKAIYINSFQFVLLILFIISLRSFYHKKYHGFSLLIFTLILSFQVSYAIETFAKKDLERLIVFNNYINPVVAYHRSDTLQIFSENALKDGFIEYNLKPYLLANHIKTTENYLLEDEFQSHAISVNQKYICLNNLILSLNSNSDKVDFNWVHEYSYKNKKTVQQIYVGGSSIFNSQDSLGLIWNLEHQGAFIIDLKDY